MSRQLEFVDFYMPFSGKLNPDNRWVKLARLVPRELAEQVYADAFRDDFGAPALSARVALGALLIKEREGLTDRGTVAAIQENPYMQSFIGLEEFTDERAFDASLMVDFRKRFGEAGLSRISEAVALEQTEAKPKEQENGSSDEDASDNDSSTGDSSTRDSDVAAVEEKTACTDANNTDSNNADANNTDANNIDSNNTNHGKLIIDATCASADIRYPTNVSTAGGSRVQRVYSEEETASQCDSQSRSQATRLPASQSGSHRAAAESCRRIADGTVATAVQAATGVPRSVSSATTNV